MALFDSKQATESGWAQVRDALQRFEGDVVGCKVGRWESTGFDPETGKPFPAQEFFEVKNKNIKVLNVSEELSMNVEGQEFTFRTNCSTSKSSFWVDNFLGAADALKVMLPQGITGKRVIWKKETREANNPRFNKTGFVLEAVLGDATAPLEDLDAEPEAVIPPPPTNGELTSEEMTGIVLELAKGKTEAQLQSAASVHPKLVGSPLLNLVRTGAVTSMLVADGKLVKVAGDGGEEVYQGK